MEILSKVKRNYKTLQRINIGEASNKDGKYDVTKNKCT